MKVLGYTLDATWGPSKLGATQMKDVLPFGLFETVCCFDRLGRLGRAEQAKLPPAFTDPRRAIILAYLSQALDISLPQPLPDLNWIYMMICDDL